MDKDMSIGKAIGLEALLGQVAEECCELGKAALKLQRIIHGTNPTPVTEAKARADLLEEACDVRGALLVLEHDFGVETYDEDTLQYKMMRWGERIMNHMEVDHETDES